MSVSGSHLPSLTSAPRTYCRSPAARRAPMSQATASPMNASRYQIASCLLAQARPMSTPAAIRHFLMPSCGPASSLGSSTMADASRARDTSLSTSIAPNAASTKNIRKMSRMPVLLSTNSRPSSDSSSPATQPSSVDLVSRRATRHMTSTASVPNSAGATRQPSGVSP